MPGPILNDLARSMERVTPPADLRGKIANGVFNASKRKRLADPTITNLERRRLALHGGYTRAELSERSTVAERVIAAAEAGEQISDVSWHRLAHALAMPGEPAQRTRQVIDPRWLV